MSEFNDQVSKMEKKLEDYLDKLAPQSNGFIKTAHASPAMSNNSYKQYRSSFLTLSDMQIPNDYREIFRWCRYFFKFDPLIGSAVRSLASFPITDWILNDTEASDDKDINLDNDESEEPSETYIFYKSILKDVNLYNHLIEIGYDYFLYGNCVIFAEPGFKVVKRRNKETGEVYEKKEIVWKSIQRLDLTRLRIDRDPKTGEKLYYYDIPPALKHVILTKHPKEKYERIPEIFKKAVEKKGLIKLKTDYIYQLQMPSESGDDGIWATPRVLHVMKLILYSNILRQAQEAIAYEHIIPRRVYFFQETPGFDAGMSFTEVAHDFALELKKQLDDPNYQIVSPVPINQIQHGGQGKALLLVPEIEQIQETILAGMGVPREFVFGGMSYSGSTTSLRILENHFITYRTSLSDYINDFLIKRLAQIRGEWETIDDDENLVTVTFSELKMQDDVQQKQLMLSLHEAGKLPDEVLYENVLGLDSTKVAKQLQSERLRKLQEQVEYQLKQMEAQQEMEMEVARRGIAPTPPVDDTAIPEPSPGAVSPNQEEAAAQGQAQAQTQGQEQEQAQAQGQEQASGNLNRIAMNAAQRMLEVEGNEAARAQIINSLTSEQARLALMYYNELRQRSAEESGEETDMRPYPEQRPPRRQGGV